MDSDIFDHNLEIKELYNTIKKTQSNFTSTFLSAILGGMVIALSIMLIKFQPLLFSTTFLLSVPFAFDVPNNLYRKYFKKIMKTKYPNITYYSYSPIKKNCMIEISSSKLLFFINSKYQVMDFMDRPVDLNKKDTKILKGEETELRRIENEVNNDKVQEYQNNNINIINLKPQNFNFAIGREKELKNLMEDIYSVKTNPIIVGNPGVGKTALVKGLAYKLQKGEVPDSFKNKQLYIVNTSELIRNAKYVGMVQERMKKFIDFAQDKDKIFFIDEFHTIIGAGTGEKNNLDVANLLKPYLDDGSINIIGATTKEEYEKYILKDKALSSRFSKIEIEEPDEKTLSLIVRENIKYFEKEYDAKFYSEFLNEQWIDSVVKYLIELTLKKHRNYHDMEYNPRLIIKIIDKAFVKCKMNNRDIVNLEDICNAIKSNSKIYDTAKNKTINSLKKEDVYTNKDKQKVIKLTNF